MKNGQMSTFFVETDSAIYLISRKALSVFKDRNLKRHYLQRLADEFDTYQEICHKDKKLN